MKILLKKKLTIPLGTMRERTGFLILPKILKLTDSEDSEFRCWCTATWTEERVELTQLVPETTIETKYDTWAGREWVD